MLLPLMLPGLLAGTTSTTSCPPGAVSRPAATRSLPASLRGAEKAKTQSSPAAPLLPDDKKDHVLPKELQLCCDAVMTGGSARLDLRREAVSQLLESLGEKVVATRGLKGGLLSRLRGKAALANHKWATALQKLRKELDEVQADRLDGKECARFSLLMEAMARRQPDETLREVAQRLALLGQAAWARQARDEAEQQLYAHYQHFDQPGTSRSYGGDIGLMGGIGLGAFDQGGQLTLCAKAGLVRGMDNDDEGFVFENRGRDVSLELAGMGSLGPAKLAASVELSGQRLRAVGYDSARQFVTMNAHRRSPHRLHNISRQAALVPAKSGASLLRRLRPRASNELRHYEVLQQQATDQHQRLGVLLGRLGFRLQGAALPNVRAPYLVPSKVASWRGRASVDAVVDAKLVKVGAGAQAAYEKTAIKAGTLTPFWKLLLPGEEVARDKDLARQRLAQLDKKLFDLSHPPGSAASQAVPIRRSYPLDRLCERLDRAVFDKQRDHDSLAGRDGGPLAMATTAELEAMTAALEAEFAHFCAVAQQCDAASGSRRNQIKLIESSVLASWRSRSREEALANMVVVHAALLRAAVAQGEPAEPLVTGLRGLAVPLYTPPIHHDKKDLARRTCFDETLNLAIRDLKLVVEAWLPYTLAGDVAGGSAGVKLALTHRVRKHHNPLRAGTYLDVRFSFNVPLGASLSLEGLRDALQAQLASHGLEDEALLDSMLASVDIDAEGGITVQRRYFKPEYQQDKAFPSSARGFRPLFTRITSARDLVASVPLEAMVAPGVVAGVSPALFHSDTRVQGERWGHGTLSYPMMHYLHLKSANELDRWPQLREQQRGALDALCRQLADKSSPVRQEAGYLLQLQQQQREQLQAKLNAGQPLNAAERAHLQQWPLDARSDAEFVPRFFAAMTDYNNGTKTFDQAVSQLEEMMSRYELAWHTHKRHFAGIKERALAR